MRTFKLAFGLAALTLCVLFALRFVGHPPPISSSSNESAASTVVMDKNMVLFSRLGVPTNVSIENSERDRVASSWLQMRSRTGRPTASRLEFEQARAAAASGDLFAIIRLIEALESLSAKGRFYISEGAGAATLNPIQLSDLSDIFKSEEEIDGELVRLIGVLSRSGVSEVSYEYAVRAGDLRKAAATISEKEEAEIIANDALRSLIDAQAKGDASAAWRLAISYSRGELSSVDNGLAEQFAKRAETLDPVQYANALKRLRT